MEKSHERESQGQGDSGVREGKGDAHEKSGAANQQSLKTEPLIFLKKLRGAARVENPFGPFPQSGKPYVPSSEQAPAAQLEGEVTCTDCCKSCFKNT
ncbi:hypothetical protein [Neorickettsia findlayensis]|uniref:Uncharacterized protein n=1 Tax=Neorickettsia findlayensis TaxID=2686014 RepID=A0A6P1GAY6_9RICK|nr:hypothetical protein [Neorickettsia findlayensis]QHD65334.1 hypothetical protein GP480_02660 [Neorickettsia findlayensis]